MRRVEDTVVEESVSPLINASNVTITFGCHELFMNPTDLFFKRHRDFVLPLSMV